MARYHSSSICSQCFLMCQKAGLIVKPPVHLSGCPRYPRIRCGVCRKSRSRAGTVYFDGSIADASLLYSYRHTESEQISFMDSK